MMRAIATFFYVGLVPVAPGTAGALAALPVAYGLHVLGGFPALALATVAATWLGWLATRAVTVEGPPAPSFVVIDEVAGQWVALWPLSFGLWMAGAAPTLFPWPGWVGAFLLFRLFDIWKPGPVGWADRLKTPWGVMLDDLIAGAMAAILVLVGALVAHVGMGV